MAILLILSLLQFFTSSFIIATAEELRVLVTPNSNVIFLIGEYHNKPNTNPGGNNAVVEKVTEILQQAEESGKGYRVFIEQADSPLFPGIQDDLLCKILPQASKFKQSTFYDIETRNCSAAACHIFAESKPQELANFFTPDKADDPEALRMRGLLKKRFKCDINLITFEDVFDEWNSQIAWFQAVSSHVSTIDCYHIVDSIKRRIQLYRDLIKECGFTEQESILQGAIAAQKRNFDAYFMNSFYLDYKSNRISYDIFNLVLINKLVEECKEPSSSPIIVIAGTSHCWIMEQQLRYFMRATEKLYVEKEALTAEDLEFLVKPTNFSKNPSQSSNFLREIMASLLDNFRL